MSRRALRMIWAMTGLLLMVACKPTVPSQYIQPDDMEDILYDYYVSQGIAQLANAPTDSQEYKRDLYFNAVLKKYGLTRADFDSSMVYYYTRADYLVGICKRVQERLGDDALSLGASEGEVERFTSQSLSGDTANVWEGNRSAVMTPYAPYNRYQFRQKADSSYHKGDTFMLVFKSDFLYQGGMKDAVAYLALRYENDSVAASVTHFSTTGNTQLRTGACDLRVKEVSGYIYLGGSTDKTPNLRLLILSDIQLIRFHKQTDAAKPAIPAAPVAKPGSAAAVPDSMRPKRHRLGERPMQIQELKTDNRTVKP